MEIPLKSHSEYFKKVLKHKWYVFLECKKLGLPLWVGIIHDWSKFTPTEWVPYTRMFYTDWHTEGKEIQDKVALSFKYAWLYHQRRNPHHWEYWVYSHNKVLEMPDCYRKEMLADWRGAGKAYTGKDNTKEWYEENKDKIMLHENTRKWIEKELGVYNEHP